MTQTAVELLQRGDDAGMDGRGFTPATPPLPANQRVKPHPPSPPPPPHKVLARR
jgi:hypothetical protein